MKHKNIFFSIIVASYNYEQYIKETLNSLANQTYKNFEVIIVDDGSKDNSIEVIKEYTNKYNNFHLYQHENSCNKGLAATLQLGIKKAKGDYIAFCESDDYLDINYLQEKLNYIKEHKQAKLITNDIQLFGYVQPNSDVVFYVSNVRNYLINNKDLKNHFAGLNKNNDCLPTFSTIMIKRNILEKLNFNSPIPEWLDWWLWRQYAIKYPIDFIDKKLTYWRKHNESYDTTASGDFDNKCQKLREFSNKLLKKKYFIEYYKYFYKSNFYSVIKNIFSVINSENHKILTVLGIKIKFKRK